MKHTPGPWHVIADPAWIGKHPLHDARFVATCDFAKVEYTMDEGEDGGRPWRFEDSKDSIICTMPDAENQKANAKLIAAAPELLAALQAALDSENTTLGDGGSVLGDDIRSLIQQKIAKATE